MNKEYITSITKKKAILLLQDGTLFNGFAIGKIGTTTGEICFNTGMTGYQEVFTDPSYYGQILVETHVHIGNYGVCSNEVESDSIKIAGLVCKNFNSIYSRKLATQSLKEYLESEGIVGISDIDTRALVRHIRSKGAMNAIISSEITDIDELKRLLNNVPSMAGLELSSKVTTKSAYNFNETGDKKVAVLDLGLKLNIARCLAERNCLVRVFPMNTPFEEMEVWGAQGYMISNGPGDPAALPQVINTVKKCIESNKPVFGICLGHQIISLASGLKTYKMHNGHRGLNHPVKNLLTGKSEITSQNHGFAVVADDVIKKDDIEITHVNLNDNTIEGIRLKSKKVFSVQYHPEASAGPHDSRYLFDDFVSLIS